MVEPLFELQEVHFRYLGKIPALCGIDMFIAEHSRTAIIGANGCGKSTLLYMLDGLIFPAKGAIRAFGMELSEKVFCDRGFSAEFRRKVGLVFQNPDTQLFSPTVREDILFGPLQLDLDRAGVEKRFSEIVDALGIAPLLERPPYQLSIGEKRKVALAGVLVIDPEVLILDEPTAGLDPATTRHIIDMLGCYGSRGKTIITSTHDLHILGEIADTVFVIGQNNKIVSSGAPAEILGNERLLEENNLAHIHAHRHQGQLHAHPHVHSHQQTH